MFKNRALSHPAIELRPSFLRSSKSQNTTILDLLEVYPDHVNWKEKLDHSSLLNHFRVEDVLNGEKSQPLRIFFVEELNFVDPRLLKAEPALEVNTTAYWMQQRFGVSPVFFSCFHSPTSVVKIGSASLMRTEAGKRVAIDGFYRFSSGFRDLYSYVWFSHSLSEGQSSTYIIHGCPENAKKLVLSYVEKRTPILIQPLLIDAILAEYSLNEWEEEAFVPRNHLIRYEDTPISQLTPPQTAEAVERLHSLSQRFHRIRGDTRDIKERLQYLVKVHQRLTALSGDRYDPVNIESIEDSFEYLMSKTTTLIVWVMNYVERTGIRINLFFNLATQSDSRTNLEIARLSSKIAVSTQRDSSSMITIAVVTMFFLPGTFVSAVFSMVFFDTKANENGGESIIVRRQWWLFPAITIPLTILVFVTWVAWKRYRDRVELESLRISNLAEIVGPDPIFGNMPNQGPK